MKCTVLRVGRIGPLRCQRSHVILGKHIYMYVANIRLEIVALLWSGLGHIHILAMGCGAVEIGGFGKGSSKPSFESGGLFGDDVG